jgi:outer membrane receptor protein involved in Fe transport
MRAGVVASAICLSIVGISAAGDAKAAMQKATVIPAQRLGPALQALARDYDFQVLYRTEVVGDLQTQGASGTMTAGEALDHVLSGTGLSYRYIDEQTVTIVPTAAGAAPGSPTDPEDGAAPAAQRDDGRKNGQSPGASRKESFWDRFLVAQVDQEKTSGGGAVGGQAAEPSARLEEVFVTSQKREERLQDVPVSIAVVSADDIDQRGLVSAGDYLRGMPGVNQTEVGYGGQAIIIRGLETNSSFLNFSGGTTVGTYFGETPTTNSAGTLGSSVDIKLVDIERVEVLRGPQGTAFGSSSMGGTVRLIPAAPQLDDFSGRVESGYSETSGNGGDNYNIQAVANIPLVEGKFALRAAAYKFSDSGFYRNFAGSDTAFQTGFVIPFGLQSFATDEKAVGSSSTTGARIAALIQPGDNLRFTLSFLTQTTETDDYPAATSGTYEQTVTQVAPEHVHRGQTGGINDNEIEIASAVMEYDFGWADLLASYSHLEGKSAHALNATLFGLAWPVSFYQDSPHTESSGEIRLVTKLDGAWNFLAGLYTEEHDDHYVADWIWFGTPSLNFFFPQERDLLDYVDQRDLKQNAAFAEASWEILPRLTLTGGVRAYDYERRTRIVQSGPALGGASVSTDDANDDSGTNYRANLSYKPNEDSLVYASWAEGFRLGRPQSPLPAGACDVDGDGIIDGTGVAIDSTGAVSSDTVESFELGAKFAFLDRRATIDIALFRMDWNNIPVQILPPCGYAYTTNAGVGLSEGIEVQANFQLTDAFLVSVGGSWNDAKLTADVPAQGFQDGDPLPGTPKESANLGLQYSFNISGHPAYIRADSIYVSRFFGDILETPTQEAGDYVKVNASARVEFGNLDMDVFVHNLTDEDAFISRGYGLHELFGYRMRPRTIGLQLSYDF